MSLGSKYEMVDALERRQTVVNPGFSSAQKTTYGSVDDQIEDFAVGVPKGRIAVLEFTVPKGFPSIDVGTPEGGLGFDQGEVLLPRGTGFRVVSAINDPSGVVMLRVMLVPPSDAVAV